MLTTEVGNEWECLPPSCRDKEWTWRRVGALCLSWWHDEWFGLCEATRSHPHEDKHKAPSSPPPRPLSLQDAGRTFPKFGSAPFIRTPGDAHVPMGVMTLFDWKNSSGQERRRASPIHRRSGAVIVGKSYGANSTSAAMVTALFTGNVAMPTAMRACCPTSGPYSSKWILSENH